MNSNQFEVKDQFYLNGNPFKIISGSIHYFRVVPEYWRDRLEKLRAMGCNTVETYVPWNLHEPRKGEFCFNGMLNVAEFLKTAQELGLWAIVRPSPYICAEWEFGGLPAWLLAKDGMRIRCTYPPYLQAVQDYYRNLFQVLAPLQINNGGPILLMQIENEYGAYGDETAYLEALRRMMHENGVTVPLFTSDGPWGNDLANGCLPGVLSTVNFGSKASQQLSVLEKHTGGGPLMCAEFWVGWFDAWGDAQHHTTAPGNCADDLNSILARGSVNFYMFHGGTNFGFMNGSNYYDGLTPDVTSYDYDAPLSEDGEITPKYLALRRVISQYSPVPPMKFSAQIEKKNYGEAAVASSVSLFSVLDDLAVPVKTPWPLSMEQLGQSYGYTLYRSELRPDVRPEKLQLLEANDRAQLFFDQSLFRTLYDRELEKEWEVPSKFGTCGQLDILVENMGRVNFGPRMKYQRKGSDGAVLLYGHSHAGWSVYCLPMDMEMINWLDFSKECVEGTPSFYLILFWVDEKGDTFLDMTGWGKGCVFLNGFALGRFWKAGPQRRLYVPAPLLRKGENKLIVFETEGETAQTVSFYENPELG